MKLSVQLVTWNGEKFLPTLFDSLRNQTFKDWDLFVIDNGSKDKTKDLLPNLLNSLDVKHKLILKNENCGFSAAHTELFKFSESEYVAVINQDLILDKNVFLNIVDFLDKNNNIASAAPCLLRMENLSKTNTIDSLGLKINRSRKFVDLYSGKDLTPKLKLDYSGNVFGVSGAIAFYRRNAVKSVNRPGELFDPSYQSYQEDVDLAWKLQLGGFDSRLIMTAVAYHERGVKEVKSKSVFKIIENKKNQPFQIRYNSYKNHLKTIYKNEEFQNLILDFFNIFCYESAKLLYYLAFDTKILFGIKDLFAERAELQKERKRIKSFTQRKWTHLRNWL